MTRAISDGIFLEASAITGIPISVLKSRTRIRDISRTRQAIMFALRLRTTWSFPMIGKHLGLDHSTVVYGYNKAVYLAKSDENFQRMLCRLVWAIPVAPYMIPVEEVKPPELVKALYVSERTKARLNARPKPTPPPPPKPAFASVEIPGYGRLLLDSNGRCREEVWRRKNMIIGSRTLAAAINAARTA